MLYKIQLGVFLFISITSVVAAQSTAKSPVTYTVEAPETVQAGESFAITVVFNIQPGWYVYAPIAMNTSQGKIPTKVSFKVPEQLKKEGDIELPDPSKGFGTYKGEDVRMSQKFTMAEGIALGKQTIDATIVYQTCNEMTCYPPVKEKVAIVITVK